MRPFNVDRHVNLRELSPSDVDQLVTIKGLVIRTSAIMPDMRAGFASWVGKFRLFQMHLVRPHSYR